MGIEPSSAPLPGQVVSAPILWSRLEWTVHLSRHLEGRGLVAYRISVVPMAALLAVASASAQTAALPPGVTEELICERPENVAGRFFRAQDQVSSDLGKVVWVFGHNVMVNCAPLDPPAEEFLEPALSPDGQHVLRAGRQAKSWFVWLDAEQIAGPFDGVRRAYFAPDGRVVFAAKRAEAWTWFVGGKEQTITTPALKGDGALCKTEYAGLWNLDLAVTREVLEHCWSALIAVTRDHVAYPAKRTDGWHLVVDGQIGPPFERILQITFSPDGSRLAYLGLRKDRVVAVVDGKEEPARDDVEGLRFSADSKRVAYLAIETSKDVTGTVVADGTPSRSHLALILNAKDDLRTNLGLVDFGLWPPPVLKPYMTGATAPQFRSDGKVVYAACTTNGQGGVWVEGADTPLFQVTDVASLVGPVLSEVGDHAGWVERDAKTDTWVGFVDGQPRGAAPGVPKRANIAQHPTLSRDGSRLAFVHMAWGGGGGQLDVYALRRVVATGLVDKPYDALDLSNLRFSDDGRHLAYEVRSAKGFAVGPLRSAGFVVLDGVPGRPYSWVMPGTMRFVGPDTVRYVAVVQEAKKAPYRYIRVTQTAP